MTKRFLPFILLAALVCLFSCKKESDDRYMGEPSRGYYPLLKGHYVVYDVDSTIWNDFDCTLKQHHYQMRYTVSDTFRDLQQRLSYQIYVLIRPNDSSSWDVNEVFSATPTPAGLEIVQNNLRFLKLVFPPVNGMVWNGNSGIATNDQDLSYFFDWKYTYSKMGESYNNGRASFDNTIIVDETDETQNDPGTMPAAYAYRTYSREVYGYDVGLVYKELTHWIYDPNVKNCRKGYSVVMRALDHN
jgi:hypothetical protein